MRSLLVTVLLLAPVFCLHTQAQQTGRALIFPVTIRWSKQKAVREYRLQIAADEKFQNVFLDKRVLGERYVADQLLPGHYYWRVAPAEPQLGHFSRPIKFFVSGGIITSVKVGNQTTRTRSMPAILITRSNPGVR